MWGGGQVHRKSVKGHGMRVARRGLESFQETAGRQDPGGEFPMEIAAAISTDGLPSQVLESIADPLMVLDRTGRVLHTSANWEAAGSGWSSDAADRVRPGSNYL